MLRILADPVGLGQDNNGNILVADCWGNRIVKYDPDGYLIGWIGGGYSGWQTLLISSSFSNELSYFYFPSDVAVDNNGFIYISDGQNYRVSKWDMNGNPVGWLGGGYSGWQTTIISITSGNCFGYIGRPNGITIDNSQNIYIADYGSNKINKYDINGSNIGWIGSSNDNWQIVGCSNPSDFYKSFYGSSNICIGENNDIYVAEVYNNRISKWDANGIAHGWIGGGYSGWQISSSSVSGIELEYFNFPRSVSYFSGNLYIADCNNNRIDKWDATSGNAIGWIGGGTPGWHNSGWTLSGDDLHCFIQPKDILVNAKGDIYVADSGNHRVCKWKD